MPSPITLSRGSSVAGSPRAQSPEIMLTNTLAITSLPKSFFEPVILDLLYSHFSKFGEIYQWVPLSGFARILVVYFREKDAENAKIHSDPIVLAATGARPEGLTLRVFRADPNPVSHDPNAPSIPSEAYLQPPATEKNFLISPPGSPPEGWEAIREDPPNSIPLAADLIEVLQKLHIQQRNIEGDGKKRSSIEVLIPPEESGVGVYLEDCDLVVDENGFVVEGDEEDDDEGWVYGVTARARSRWTPIPTAMPPVRPIST